ncbi:unnamed protein product, partial [Ectocarpus fasciculatus]
GKLARTLIDDDGGGGWITPALRRLVSGGLALPRAPEPVALLLALIALTLGVAPDATAAGAVAVVGAVPGALPVATVTSSSAAAAAATAVAAVSADETRAEVSLRLSLLLVAM